MHKLILTALVMLFASPLAWGQQGAIAGTVFDEDGFPMLGANVSIQGTSTGAQTDFIEGKYQFKADPGTYTILATYVGYGNKTIEGVVVEPNETVILDIAFTEDAGVDLQLDVTVSTTRLERGEIAVLQMRQNSDKVQDVISSQEISRIGAGTAAAAMTKVTGTTVVDGKYVYVRGLGDRYSATTINGLRLPSIDPYRNAAQLDLIPTNLLDNIVASKTFTPDLPGDFTGGSINIKLKALPERFTWGVSASTAYNSIGNLRSDFQTFDAGDKAGLGFNDGTLDRPAILDNPLIDELNVLDPGAAGRARRDDVTAGLVDEVAKSFGNNFDRATDRSPLNYSVSANVGNQFRVGTMPVGVFGSAGYSRDYSFRRERRGNYFNPGGGDVLFRVFDYDGTTSTSSPKLNGMLGLSLKPNSANRITAYGIYSHQAFQEVLDQRGANDDYTLSGDTSSFFRNITTSFMQREMQNYVVEGLHTIKALGNAKIEWAGNYVDAKQLEPDTRFFAYQETNGFAQINSSLYTDPRRVYRDLNDVSYQGKLDITVPFLQKKSKGNTLKIGGLYNTMDRQFNEFFYEYKNRDGVSLEESGADPATYFNPSNLGVIGGEPGRNVVGLYLTDVSRPDNSYVGSSDVAAGYAMLTYELTNRFRVIAGLRVEETKINVVSDKAAVVTDPENFIADIDTTTLLPAVNLVYKFGKDGGVTSNVRASFSQTLARPNMRELAPFASFGFISEPPVVGNPNLGLTSINNFDLRYEIFPGAGDVFAVSGFYKSFKDPIVLTFLLAGQLQYTWENPAEAELYGIEFEVRKNLGFISSKLASFAFSSNFTFIESSQSIDPEELKISRAVDPEFDGQRPFSGQSPFVTNVNLSWDSSPEAGWDAYLSYNYFGDRLSAVGGAGTPDIYERGRSTLDLSVGKKLGNFHLSLRGRNLFNPVFKLSSEYRGEEYIYSEYERGREVSLGIAYGI
ncbi:TonB-dependent receptor [Neolewinella antarctica]|uniref:TonB-dependent receptor n=1 Tax=Neolewinella antarctica TaxID=442734 RepID=A0ABX0XAV6_9BACT|nr:TonB-dependent receptor [Neolewinella antarctica]NJC26352.1 TonB-dependent receptor [Neolewinella antarctica]